MNKKRTPPVVTGKVASKLPDTLTGLEQRGRYIRLVHPTSSPQPEVTFNSDDRDFEILSNISSIKKILASQLYQLSPEITDAIWRHADAVQCLVDPVPITT